MALIRGNVSTRDGPELEAQRIWYDSLGKGLGFPPTGADALWTTSAEKFDGEGTTLHKTFPKITYTTTTWLSQIGNAKQQIPLITRVVGRTNTKIVFLAGAFGVHEATKSYINKQGETYVARNVSPEDLVTAYNSLYPNLRTKMGRAVQAGEQSQLTEWTGEADEARETLEKLPEGYELTKKRRDTIQLVNQAMPAGLFETTQLKMLEHGAGRWLMTIISPDSEDGNPHYRKYVRDGFRPFFPIADELIKYMDRLAKQGHEELGQINEYFKEIKAVGEVEGTIPGAKWMVRPPDNNKAIMEIVESLTAEEDPEFPTGWKTQLEDFGKSESWRNILSKKVIDFRDPKDIDDKKVEPSKPSKYKTPSQRVGRRIKPFVREAGEDLIDPDTNELVIGEHQRHDTPLGRRSVVNTNWEGGCCQRLKMQLIAMTAYKKPHIHITEIERKIFAMPCHELNEYMEPPGIEDNNFQNLRFFGVEFGEFSQNDVFESIGIAGDAHEQLWQLYSECLDEELESLESPKAPTERTDPKGDTHWVKNREGEVEEVEFGEEEREFEGFKWDTGKPGEIDVTPLEAKRIELIHARREQLGQDAKSGDWMRHLQPEVMSQAAYEKQKEAMLKPTRQEWKKMMDLIAGGLTLSDSELWEKMGYSDAKTTYVLGNKDDLSREFGDLY